jgi:hypothetical protein
MRLGFIKKKLVAINACIAATVSETRTVLVPAA